MTRQARETPGTGSCTLLGADLALPGDHTPAVAAFQRWQQSQVDLWIDRAVAAGVPRTTRGANLPVPVAVVELPVLSTRWRVGRRLIDGAMTSGIGDPDVLARTITVYTDVPAFQRSLGIPDSDDVHALVVTRGGDVLARGHGAPTDTSWTVVAAALRAG